MERNENNSSRLPHDVICVTVLSMNEDQQPTNQVEVAGETAPQDELPALQALIERQASRADQLRAQIKTIQDSLKSILENDPELVMAEETAKAQNDKTKSRKKTLTQSPEYRSHQAKASEIKDELKEIEEALNSFLISYFQKTGVKAVDTSDGSQREFRLSARLLPKNKKDEE